MAWFKVDDLLPDHRKVRRLRGDKLQAIGLWTLCGAWSGRNLQDGYVPDDVVDDHDVDHLMAKRLVDVGLWERVEGPDENGYQFHDWDQANPMREEVMARRQWEADRKRERREKSRSEQAARVPGAQGPGRSPTGTPTGTPAGHGESPIGTPSGTPDGSPPPSPNGVRTPRPDPTRPDPVSTSSGHGGRSTGGPPREAVHTPSAATAESVVAEWRLLGKRSKQLNADVTGQVRSFFSQGFDGADIREAVTRWAAKGSLGAGVLPSFLDEVVNGSRTNGSAPPSAAPAVDPDDPMTWGDDQLSRVLGFEPRPTLPSELMDDGVPRSDRDAWLRENIPAWRNGRRLAAKARLEAKAAR